MAAALDRACVNSGKTEKLNSKFTELACGFHGHLILSSLCFYIWIVHQHCLPEIGKQDATKTEQNVGVSAEFPLCVDDSLIKRSEQL